MNQPQYQKQNQGQQEDITPKIAEEIRKISTLKDFYGETLVKNAETLGKFFAEKKLTTNQIRKFLDAVNRLKLRKQKEPLNFRDEAMMIKPQLAYAAERQKVVKPFMRVINACIDKVQDEKDLEIFVKFVEAIVAYHKYYGGE